MEFGAHLPLIPMPSGRSAPWTLRDYAATAAGLGYRWLTANDHLVFRRPWLDGLTALASVIDASGDMGLATTVCLPSVRGPVPTAKAFTALDLLSGGRFAGGVGPGSGERDLVVAGADPRGRFDRFDEAVRALRVLLRRDPGPFEGRAFSTAGVDLEPPPRPGRPPIWMAGWGRPRGLRRAAELGDGWLASAYNTTPAGFAASWSAVRAHVAARGGDPDRFANGVATAWTYVTEDRGDEERILRDVLAPLLGRPAEDLAALALPIGPAERCAERVAAFRDAGAQRLLIWPLGDELAQLARFMERVAPHVAAG
ncbi:MAG TPA: LLM class flavin-dependent oxidoreductase [Miltoncostaeaceae bacterium]|jgi:alkanesulfonate monooxygenase SsuD/methylene tetrahydromethanopterin reductase-like flavin-dependent oxidoreductase (luciferase family)|nr:LLM class flavin-dependent oxidoreductase [Miltoncostaeaceae bacterium]